MYVEAFTNLNWRAARHEGYSPGDGLELCYTADRPDLADLSPEDIAQSVYGTCNPRDHEFDKHYSRWFPSLSVGDVVSCRDGETEWSLAVDFMGFKAVHPPVFASDAEHTGYREKIGSEDRRGVGR